jgi:ADP-dependent NAD(P)H-hydrate dehydratase / NAD(P)H-hydrate epimerase
MIVTAQQMKDAEHAAFASGIIPEELMEIAGNGIARCIRQFFPKAGEAIVFCGKGHNGGDALVAARHLLSAGWKIQVTLACSEGDLAPLTRRHLEDLGEEVLTGSRRIARGETLIVIDGLLGIGVAGAPRGVVADRIRELNALRQAGAFIVSVDLPSGLDATNGEVFDPCVQADLTVSLGFVKTGLVADGATAFTGRLAEVPLPGLSPAGCDASEVSTAPQLARLLPVRDFDTHKGNYGRIGIVAGSPGYLGAARLCSAAAVHAGGGLVTLYALPGIHDQLSLLSIPEVMVRRVESCDRIFEERLDVLAIGPGLGRSHDQAIRDLVQEAAIPCVVDADVLNALSGDISLLKRCRGARLLTPHPGEMERLNPCAGRSRRLWAEEFVGEYPVTLLLKGARTLIAEREQPVAFNTTGNPGMGSGGMGDVLTGVCAALIGSGKTPRQAALLGAWICGRSAELAVSHGGDSQESLSASSVIANLGGAFTSLRTEDF